MRCLYAKMDLILSIILAGAYSVTIDAAYNPSYYPGITSL